MQLALWVATLGRAAETQVVRWILTHDEIVAGSPTGTTSRPLLKPELESLRAELGVDRKALAALLGISPSELLGIERGQASPPADFAARMSALREKAPALRRLSPNASAQRTFYMAATRFAWPSLGLVVLLLIVQNFLASGSPLHWAIRSIALGVGVYGAVVGRRIGPFCSECNARTNLRAPKCKSCGARFEQDYNFVHASPSA